MGIKSINQVRDYVSDSNLKKLIDKFKDIIWCLPVSELLYVGKSTQRKLTSRGIMTIGDLANSPVDLLVDMLGKWGEVLS